MKEFKMLKAEPIFKNMIAFTNPEPDTFYKAYVNKRYYKKLNLNYYTPFPIDAILNAKSISFKKLTFREYIDLKGKNKI